MVKFWVIAGESSGDGYGASAVRELRSLRPDAEILAMGGEKMREAGADIRIDSTELGVVGFVEVVKKLPFFIGLLKRLSKEIIESAPDGVLLIDYPGFNLQLAKRLHRAGIRVIWYISPQVWAWKKGRIPKLAASVDKMLCIFPFEPEVYAGSGLNAEFVGHPLLETLAPLRNAEISRETNHIVLLPGSRSRELHAHLPLLIDCALELKRLHPDLLFDMPLQRERSRDQVMEYLMTRELPDDLLKSLNITFGDAREVMRRGTAGIAASGTVTVEAALLGLPLVVIYKINWFTWMIAKRLIHLDYVSIINLVMKAPIYEEKLQDMAIPSEVVPAVEKLLPGGCRADEMPRQLREFAEHLGGTAGVSRRVAQELLLQ